VHSNLEENEMSSVPLIEITSLKQLLDKYATDRGWEKFHSPKNLVMALSGEVGELADIFQWLTEAESHAVMQTSGTQINVNDEVADVMIYLVRLISVLDLDINQAIVEKLKKNTLKYPALLNSSAQDLIS
jgi:dCTP diphosphatase